MEQDVVDDMAVCDPIDQIADRAADDQRKAGSGQHLPGIGCGRETEHESDDGRATMTTSPPSPIQQNIEKATPVL